MPTDQSDENRPRAKRPRQEEPLELPDEDRPRVKRRQEDDDDRPRVKRRRDDDDSPRQSRQDDGVQPQGQDAWAELKAKWHRLTNGAKIGIIAGVVFLFFIFLGMVSGASGGGTIKFDRDNASKFTDNTAAYKGKKVQVRVNYDGGGSRRDDRLISFTGRVYFRGNGSFDISFDVPPEAPQPNIKPRDDLIVTFVCTEGKLGDGNNVVKIERP